MSNMRHAIAVIVISCVCLGASGTLAGPILPNVWSGGALTIGNSFLGGCSGGLFAFSGADGPTMSNTS